MGMYDTIHCTYDLGPGFWRKSLQTKDLNCGMSEYWLSPIGELYEIDYSDTQDFVDGSNTLLWRPNGIHGKVRPHLITTTIEVYPAKWDCKYAPFPSCQIVLYDGKLVKVVRRL